MNTTNTKIITKISLSLKYTLSTTLEHSSIHVLAVIKFINQSRITQYYKRTSARKNIASKDGATYLLDGGFHHSCTQISIKSNNVYKVH